MARAARNRGSQSAARSRNGGQALVVTIIVLFVLLFLGGVFVALIANNLRNTRRGVQVSAADKFAEAGIKYLDQQLMTSPEGADWRPIPDCPPSVAVCANVPTNDPDYFFLKPLVYNPESGEYEGGYTRVNFGGSTPSSTNSGGRALVRVTYRPYQVDPATGNYRQDLNGDGDYADADEIVAPANADRTRRFVKLESVGRVGVVDSLDPTTFSRSEGLGLRRELVAYKALGLTESLRFITDKDKRRPVATLGAPYTVQDRSLAATGDPTAGTLFGGLTYDAATKQFTPVGGFLPNGTRNTTNGDAVIVNRPIYNVYQGAIRSNTDLTFYGLNYLALDPRRGDALQVSGRIGLNAINSATATIAATDPTKLYITGVAPTVKVSDLGATTVAGNVLPSDSGNFTTFDGLVRDNPRGNETQGLPADTTVPGTTNNNLRAVPRLEPPVIDAATGDNGLTRYRALTRDSARLSTVHTGTSTTPTDNDLAVTIDPRYAGAYGWGQNLYIPNAVDLPSFSEALTNVNSSSQRAEWLNPQSANGTGQNWRTDGLYIPPAVSITLTPRWMALNQSQTTPARNRPYLRRPDSGRGALPVALSTLYRYSYDTGNLLNAPVAGIDEVSTSTSGGKAFKFAGYPVTYNATTGYYEGDLVIFAEGNIRIKGSVGGYDPETKQTFVRHLTVVSNGTVYIDGSVLRDNISPEMAAANPAMAAAKGKSTIALLAKNYIAVNTTQFLSTSDFTALAPANTAAASSNTGSGNAAQVLRLDPRPTSGNNAQSFNAVFAPIVTFNATTGLPNIGNVFYNSVDPTIDLNRTPPYLSDPATSGSFVSLLVRHAPESDLSAPSGAPLPIAAIALAMNAKDPAATPGVSRNYFDFNTPGTEQLDFGTVAQKGKYFNDVFRLNEGTGANYLYPNNVFPYTVPVAQIPSVGTRNLLQLESRPNTAGVNPTSASPYLLNRVGVVPLDIRIEALMYAQEGSFFIIPGASFNPNPNDSLTSFLRKNNVRTDENIGSVAASKAAQFPFYGEPLDIRITMFGAITENLPAEIGDQGAWLQKWGWVPRFNGSTGFDPTTGASDGSSLPTFHGSVVNTGGTPSVSIGGVHDGVGNGINYVYDPRLASPYDNNGAPIRINPNFAGVPATFAEPLPPMPRLPLAPGLLYYGDRPIR